MAADVCDPADIVRLSDEMIQARDASGWRFFRLTLVALAVDGPFRRLTSRVDNERCVPFEL